jgi:FAD-dependent monooxygenase
MRFSRPKTEDGGKVRAQIVRHLQEHDGENKNHGIELDYRYTHLLVIVPDMI